MEARERKKSESANELGQNRCLFEESPAAYRHQDDGWEQQISQPLSRFDERIYVTSRRIAVFVTFSRTKTEPAYYPT